MTLTDTSGGDASTDSALADTRLVPVDDGDDPLPGTTIGRYRVEARLGAGGMGVVYAAHDPALDRRVALKLMRAIGADRRDDVETRLRREAQALARLAHPNVVAVHDVGIAEAGLYVAMQLIDGGTLQDHLARGERSAPEVIALYLDAARGLAAAHDAGIVHRDVKPSNILVDRRGRVYVGDFGLARADDEPADAIADPTSSLLEARVTHAGAVMGTPLFMAPEQHRGEPAGARSDQFSFCVSLWLALFGVHPFSTGRWDGAAVREAMTRDDVAEPPRRPGVSARLVRALRRGLRHDPEARWPSMDALIAELTPRSRAAVIWAGVSIGGIAGAVAVTAVFAGGAPAATQACPDPRPLMAASWSAERASALRAAFAAAGDDGTGAGRVIAQLDRYAARWVDARRDACEATRVRAEQSEPLLDLRLYCLDRRRAELDARVSVLTEAADASVVARADGVVGGLSSVDACADPAHLRGAPAPPDDPALRDRILALARRVEELKATANLGRVRDVVDALPGVAAEAAALDDPDLEANALLLLGSMESELGRIADSRRHLEAGLRAAGRARRDALIAQVALRLLFLTGVIERDAAAADAYEKMVEALIARLGDRADLQARFHDYVAILRAIAGRYDDAIAHGEQALALWPSATGPTYLALADTRMNLATFHLDAGRPADAERLYREAIAILETTVGERHPSVAIALQNLGSLLDETGAPGAIDTLERALRIFAATTGDDSWNAVIARGDLAEARRHAGDVAGAEADARAALAIAEPMRGDAAAIAGMHETLAEVLVGSGRGAEAVAAIERAVAVAEGEGDPAFLGRIRATAASVIAAAGDVRRGRKVADGAVAGLEQAGATGWELAWARGVRGRLRWQLGDRAGGLAEVRAAAAELEAAGSLHYWHHREVATWLAGR
jgi:eukaryotic-like serine/threonine-protein kinase